MTKKCKTMGDLLPNKPSELILVALKDLVKAEKSKKYRVNMDMWHEGVSRLWEDKAECQVCFAGSVVAFELGMGRNHTIMPDTFPPSLAAKLYALDNFRTGAVAWGFVNLGLNKTKGRKFDRRIEEYDNDPILFKRQMRELAADLRKGGF